MENQNEKNDEVRSYGMIFRALKFIGLIIAILGTIALNIFIFFLANFTDSPEYTISDESLIGGVIIYGLIIFGIVISIYCIIRIFVLRPLKPIRIEINLKRIIVTFLIVGLLNVLLILHGTGEFSYQESVMDIGGFSLTPSDTGSMMADGRGSYIIRDIRSAISESSLPSEDSSAISYYVSEWDEKIYKIYTIDDVKKIPATYLDFFGSAKNGDYLIYSGNELASQIRIYRHISEEKGSIVGEVLAQP